MTNRLSPSFFKKNTLNVAKELLGTELLYESDDGQVGGIISETEAYTEDDPACHAFKGKKTPRNAPMFLNGGHIYIYFIYGMYHCLNFVTEKEGVGAAVLIRELIPTKGLHIIKQHRSKIKNESQLLNGPSKLMIGLNIKTSLNGTYLWHQDSPFQLIKRMTPTKIQQLERIGIREGIEKKWRFKAKFDN
ncbi:MAG: DNA-3-methyladenine glycosylase [Candidatus Margulisiibacteriota bacterium]